MRVIAHNIQIDQRISQNFYIIALVYKWFQ